MVTPGRNTRISAANRITDSMLLLSEGVQVPEVGWASRYTGDVTGRNQQRRFGFPTWILVVAGFLILLLVAATAIHPVFVPLCWVLLPIFLFGRLEGSSRRVTTSFADDVPWSSGPDLPALFQRPPPSFS